MGRGKLSLSKKIKESVKKAVQFIEDFETTAMDLAIDQGYDYVICGHIHQPKIRGYENEKGSVIYMNSGDWVENLTSLEYDGDGWQMYRYREEDYIQSGRIEKLLIKHKKNERVYIG
jgi:UDP-2,3-diacylglucosamine pyrophosphatase LpxH